MKRLALLTAVLLAGVAAFGAWYAWGPSRAPQGQQEIVEITPQTLEQVRAAFNDAAAHPRMIALLSPT